MCGGHPPGVGGGCDKHTHTVLLQSIFHLSPKLWQEPHFSQQAGRSVLTVYVECMPVFTKLCCNIKSEYWLLGVSFYHQKIMKSNAAARLLSKFQKPWPYIISLKFPSPPACVFLELILLHWYGTKLLCWAPPSALSSPQPEMVQ